MDDPFFAASRRRDGAPWGQHESYAEDIFRTYKPNALPVKNSKEFEDALQFRLKEKKQFQDLRKERDHFSELLFSSSSKMSQLTSSLEEMTSQFSSLKAEHERHLASSARVRSVDTVPPEQRTDSVEPREEEHKEDVQQRGGEGTQLRETDLGGHTDEHVAEGRPPADDNSGTGERVREGPVREGGE